MSNKRITDLANPTAIQDAATKAYVDEQAAGAIDVTNRVFQNLDNKMIGFLPLDGGDMSWVIDMGNNKITNLADPIESNEAVNKKYVDEQSTGAKGYADAAIKVFGQTTTGYAVKNYVSTEVAKYLPLVGGTMAGVIDMGNHKITGLAEPTEGNESATKSYVDEQTTQAKGYADAAIKVFGQSTTEVAKYLSLAGGNMAGVIDMGNHKITGLSDPTEAHEAVNKKYVDNKIF